MEVKKVLTKRDLRIIRGAINSTIEQLKSTILKNERIPASGELYGKFVAKLPFLLENDRPSKHYINSTNRTTFLNEVERSGIYQVIFYFNGKIMYVSVLYKDYSYRSNKDLGFSYDITFLDELDSDIDGEDYLLESIIEGCQIEDVGIQNKRLD
ncbi:MULTISPECIES: hypothetical protein [unclassified Carboxylicivirga]|uniref:hypothetical protein n=1 Tax=Carboxylicivirga TaxID=1628153 RepID=UPI003D33213D